VDNPGPIHGDVSLSEVTASLRGGEPVRFDRFMGACLYDPEHGFYASGGRAGARAGDFLTSPEVGPLFGAVLARAVDSWWDAAGQPPVFTVVEVGAGPGTLAAAVRLAAPRCAPVLRWIMVERTAVQRQRHRERLAASDGPPPDGGPPDDGPPVDGPPRGDVARVQLYSQSDMPHGVAVDVIVANELLDNLAVRVVERTDAGWAELWVTSDGDSDDGVVAEMLIDLGPDDAKPGPSGAPDIFELLDAVAPEVPAGHRVPVQLEAMAWLNEALTLVGENGRVVVFDYADTTASMAGRGMGAWLRTYSGHGRGSSPLADCGAQDITCDVAVDQLAVVRPPDSERSQAQFLRAHGIDDLVDEGRRLWEQRSGIADLAAVTARSRITEAEALTDPSGLGAHRVMEWRPADRTAGDDGLSR